MATVNFSEECQDKDGTARLCIPGLSSQKESTPRDDSSQDVFRGANMSAVDAVSRQVPIATTLGNKESALREADVREDCVNICEESLTYSSESLHKVSANALCLKYRPAVK